MRRVAFVLACLCLFAVPALSTNSPAQAPAWQGLDQKVTASVRPMSADCYMKCDHPGVGGICLPVAETWLCTINESTGECRSFHVCF